MPTPDCFIKNIAFEINPEYSFDNTPALLFENKQDYENFCRLNRPKFIEREKQQKKFLEFLNNARKKGVFLVTGFRGMGKTSFVNNILNEYKFKSGEEYTDKENVIPIHLTLAQNCPKEIDILRLITSSVYDRYLKFLPKSKNFYSEGIHDNKRKGEYRIGMIATGIIITICILIIAFREAIQDFITLTNGDNGRYTVSASQLFDNIRMPVVFCLLIGTIAFLYSFWNFFKVNAKLRAPNLELNPLERIRVLRDRCYGSVITSDGGEEDVEVGGVSLNKILGSNASNKSVSMPLATEKEIEYELQQFLNEVTNPKYGKIEFIFVFDELDKVETVIAGDYFNADLETFEKMQQHSNYQLDFRNRKQAILNIISGLKNFFTTASARFIFIAGHEMFDASLADISDRQSAISSIFTYTFNIDSLLKERDNKKSASKTSLSGCIEEILSEVLFGEMRDKKKSLFENVSKLYLKNVNVQFSEPNEAERVFAKTYYTIQNFVTYLTYRSNGSPKKLIKAIQEFITIEKEEHLGSSDKLVCLNLLDSPCNPKPHLARASKYLYFNYYNQYKTGFINYLYRPFLIHHGRSFKLQRDSIILSTPYLFDHLIKFHPFAFSVTNLEMIPEVMSSSKTPLLKEHISGVISFLGTNHIRETEIGIFDYKFYSRSANEIVFITKLFEEESAAFNFTLDESYLMKLHVNNKLKELRSIFAKFLHSSKSRTNQLFSITHLHGMLGDLHFFDMEFDDAIINYSDAIRPLEEKKITEFTVTDFVSMYRNKLKLGLCFEKVNSYDEALSFYIDACHDAKKFMFYQGKMAKKFKMKRSDEMDKAAFNTEHFKSSSLNDLLQIINQGFLAKMILQEKMGVEGLSTRKMSEGIGSFYEIAFKVSDSDVYRNNLIVSNGWLLTGRLFYYKNAPASTKCKKVAVLGFSKKYSHQFIKLQIALNRKLSNEISKEGRFCISVRKRLPVLALTCYIIGLDEICRSREIHGKFIDNIRQGKNFVNEIFELFREVHDCNDETFSNYHFRYIASLISSVGDCLLAAVKIEKSDNRNLKQYEIPFQEIFSISKIQEYEKCSAGMSRTEILKEFCFIDFINPTEDGKIDIQSVIKLYWLAGQYFLKCGRSVSCSFQYRKILQVLRIVICSDGNPYSRGVVNILELFLADEIFKISAENSMNTDRHGFEKIKSPMTEVIGDIPNQRFKEIGISRNSNHPETREVVAWIFYIKIKLRAPLPSLQMANFINPYNSFSSQLTRLIELDVYAKYSNPRFEFNSVTAEQMNQIFNYVYTLAAIIRKLKIYGSDYLSGVSYSAYIHFKLAEILDKIGENPSVFKHVKDAFIDFSGKDNYTAFDKIYHYRMAHDYYVRAIQLHTGGKEYRNQLGNMVYLEDDFNDNAYHFGAAQDRYLMTNGVFHSCLRKASSKIRESDDFNVKDFY